MTIKFLFVLSVLPVLAAFCPDLFAGAGIMINTEARSYKSNSGNCMIRFDGDYSSRCQSNDIAVLQPAVFYEHPVSGKSRVGAFAAITKYNGFGVGYGRNL